MSRIPHWARAEVLEPSLIAPEDFPDVSLVPVAPSTSVSADSDSETCVDCGKPEYRIAMVPAIDGWLCLACDDYQHGLFADGLA